MIMERIEPNMSIIAHSAHQGLNGGQKAGVLLGSLGLLVLLLSAFERGRVWFLVGFGLGLGRNPGERHAGERVPVGPRPRSGPVSGA